MQAGHSLILWHPLPGGDYLAALNCDGTGFAALGLEDLAGQTARWNLNFAATSEEKLAQALSYVLVHNQSEGPICNISLQLTSADGEASQNLLENAFQPRQIGPGEKFIVNAVPGSYQLGATLCDESRAWNELLDVEGEGGEEVVLN
jgi:hypothetical protein